MPHPLAAAERLVHPWTDCVESAQRLGDALDVRLATVDTLCLADVRQLAHDVGQAHTSSGGTAHAWYRSAIAALAARERAVCPCGEACCVNLDTSRVLASANVGSRAGNRERSYWERKQRRGR